MVRVINLQADFYINFSNFYSVHIDLLYSICLQNNVNWIRSIDLFIQFFCVFIFSTIKERKHFIQTKAQAFQNSFEYLMFQFYALNAIYYGKILFSELTKEVTL